MALGNAASAHGRADEEPGERHEVVPGRERSDARRDGSRARRTRVHRERATSSTATSAWRVCSDSRTAIPEKVLDGLGTWDMATNGSTIRLHACCGASHWGQDALQKILQRPPDARRTRSSRSRSRSTRSSSAWCRTTTRRRGWRRSTASSTTSPTIALDGRAGLHQYSDDGGAAARSAGADAAGHDSPGRRAA